MQTVAEIPTFTRQADKLLNEGQKRQLIDFLADKALAGDLIPGTGGVRKHVSRSPVEASEVACG